MTIPMIGLTLDSEQPGGYSKFPWYALRQNYAGAVARAGGLPFGLAHETELAEAYLERLDGLLVTGGDFDVDPALFGDEERHETVSLKEDRTAFELALLRGAMDRDMPVLAICGGQQLLHVALGGRLIQHIPDAVPDCLAHEQPNPRNEPGHPAEIKPGTLLFEIVGENEIAVNSAHHQAAADQPGTLEVNAVAPDGVIEGIEARGYSFCLGVQWHPEFEITLADVRLFAAFVDAARRYRR